MMSRFRTIRELTERVDELKEANVKMALDNAKLIADHDTLLTEVLALRRQEGYLQRTLSRVEHRAKVQEDRSDKFLKMRQETFDARRLSAAATIAASLVNVVPEECSLTQAKNSVSQLSEAYTDALLAQLGMERPE